MKQLKLDGRVVDEDPTASLDRKFPADNQLVPGVQVVAFKPSSGAGEQGRPLQRCTGPFLYEC